MAVKDKYLTISQVAEVLNVTRQTVSRWVASRKIPGEKVGRETLIEKKVLLEWFQNPTIKGVVRDIFLMIMMAYTDYCREKGYIEFDERVDNPKPDAGHIELTVKKGDDSLRTFRLSPKENAEIQSRYEPRVRDYLEELFSAIREKTEGLIPADYLPTKREETKECE